MIEGLHPYPEYKASGIEWLGSVPTHWRVLRGKTLFRCVDVRSTTGTEELLTVSSERGVVPRSSATVTMFKAESYVGYKLCWPGDLVINSLWAWARGLGVSKHHGIVSSAYGVYRLRKDYARYAGYVDLLVRSSAFQWELQVRSKGIWLSRLQLTDDAFLDAPFPVPPETDQAAIVRFLDYADRLIHRYIRAKKQLIKLLEEQKQAIIHRAVTHGPDPSVRLKPTGIEWLGDVPHHWHVLSLGRGLQRIDQGWSPLAAEGEAMPDQWAVLTLSSVKRGYFDATAIKPIPVSAKVPDALEVSNGDLLLTRSNTRELVGDVCVVQGVRPKTILCDLIYRLTVERARFDRRFLMFQLLSPIGRRQIERDARGSSDTMPKIAQRHIRAWKVVAPPLEEQHAIVKAIEHGTQKFNIAMSQARAEIALVNEYRTRLIADAVTGKLDVREAAARLPREIEKEESVAEEELVEEGDLEETQPDQADEEAA